MGRGKKIVNKSDMPTARCAIALSNGTSTIALTSIPKRDTPTARIAIAPTCILKLVAVYP